MKVSRIIGNGLEFTVEGDTQKAIFEGLADLDKMYAEVFGERSCGCCNNENVAFQYRDVEYEEKDDDGKVIMDKKTNKPKMKKSRYYEMVCRDRNCWAKLSFGQHQEGQTLFPKRKDGEKWLPNRGWKKFVKNDQSQAPKKDAAGNDIPF